MEALASALSMAASLAALAAPPAALALGIVPRLGPGRATALALASRFSRAATTSQRTGDVQHLHSMLACLRRDQYIVVAGPKGVGKTCIVETATLGRFGVVTVGVAPGTSHSAILSDVFTALTRYYLRSLDQSGSARRVLWWHRLLFRSPATVVLQAAERKPSQPFADLDSAARALSHDFGLCVIIDASDNSLPGAARATLREVLLDVEPMPRAVLEALPELAPLLAALREAELADLVWSVVGGVPDNYLKLWGSWERSGRGDAAPVVATFVADVLGRAVSNVEDAAAADARLQAVFDIFRRSTYVHYSVLRERGITRPSPDKVLRVAPSPSGAPLRALVPADAATALVLRLGLTDAPSLQGLAGMLREVA